MGIRCDTMHWSRIQSDYNKTPGARGGHTMTLDSTETRIIMFGGQHPGPDECFLYMTDLHVFDVETLEWFSPRVTGKLPPPRSFHSAFCIETRFFVFGGSGPNGSKYNDVWCLNLETSIWSKVQVAGKPPCARYWHSSAVHGNKLMVSCVMMVPGIWGTFICSWWMGRICTGIEPLARPKKTCPRSVQCPRAPVWTVLCSYTEA